MDGQVEVGCGGLTMGAEMGVPLTQMVGAFKVACACLAVVDTSIGGVGDVSWGCGPVAGPY